MTTPAPFVPIAEVTAAVGLRGEVRLVPLVDWHEPILWSRFLAWDTGEEARPTAGRDAGGRPVVRFAGCVDRTSAETLIGREVGFRRASYLEADFPRPAGGLPFRWVGRPVLTVAGLAVGEVVEVRLYGSQPTLVVAVAAGEVLVPAVPPILRPEDGLEGPLVIDPPEGLLDAAAD